MRVILHIMTRQNDALAEEVVREQQQQTDLRVQIADFTKPNVDYGKVLAQIFQADSIQVW